MLQVISAILGMIKTGTDISAASTKGNAAKLGYDLFTIYMSLDQIIVTGEQLIHDLNHFLVYTQEHALDYNRRPYNARDIEKCLFEQSLNIKKFRESVRAMLDSVIIVGGDFERKIRPLLSDKASLIDSLIYSLRDCRIPIMPQLNGLTFEDADEAPSLHLANYVYIRDNAILCRDYLSIDLAAVVEELLETQILSSNLDDIERYAEEYRSCIEKNFSISEILKISERKRKERNRNHSFNTY